MSVRLSVCEQPTGRNSEPILTNEVSYESSSSRNVPSNYGPKLYGHAFVSDGTNVFHHGIEVVKNKEVYIRSVVFPETLVGGPSSEPTEVGIVRLSVRPSVRPSVCNHPFSEKQCSDFDDR